MKESILHFIWQYKLYNAVALKTTDGQSVEIINGGYLNSDAGPDFFNAKIEINGVLWVGNIEIHIKSSDWEKHNHHHDKSYDNVILHVVHIADTEVYRTDGEKIPQLQITIPNYVQQSLSQLQNSKLTIPCRESIANIDKMFINSWKNRLLIERLEQKTESIENLLNSSQNNWEQAFYITLARSFGFGINSDPFEMLAKQTPIITIAKHKDNLMQIEAMLFGQAGMLTDKDIDPYHNSLYNEYKFLKNKYNLQPIDGALWKMLRLRPDNFPTIRIAQFSKLLHLSTKLFSKILEQNEVVELRKLFTFDVSEYWKEHYLFGKNSKKSEKKIGKSSIDILLINTIIPCIFLYNSRQGDNGEKVIQLLEKIPSENNSIIKEWREIGLKSESAADSQALLQLKKRYCTEKRCTQCRVGHKVLSKR